MSKPHKDIQQFLKKNSGSYNHHDDYISSTDTSDLDEIYDIGYNPFTENKKKHVSSSSSSLLGVKIMDDIIDIEDIHKKNRDDKKKKREDVLNADSDDDNNDKKEGDDYHERIKILNREPIYRLLKAIAGEMLMDTEDLYEQQSVVYKMKENDSKKRKQSYKEAKVQKIKILRRKIKRLEKKQHGLEYTRFIKIQPQLIQLLTVLGDYKIIIRDMEKVKDFTNNDISRDEERYEDISNKYGYFVLLLLYSDYDMFFNSSEQIRSNQATTSNLKGLLNRFNFLYYDNQSLEKGSTMIEFKQKLDRYNELKNKEDIYAIALLSLYFRDIGMINTDYPYRYSFDEKEGVSLPDSLINKNNLLANTIEKSIIGFLDVDNFNDILEETTRLDDLLKKFRTDMNNPDHKEKKIIDNNIDVISHVIQPLVKENKIQQSYAVLLSKLFNARNNGDNIEIDSLLKNKDITKIHTEELNKIIQSMGKTNTTSILDRIKEYYKEKYFEFNDIIDIYNDSIKDDSKYIKKIYDELSVNYQDISILKRLYDSYVFKQIKRIIKFYLSVDINDGDDDDDDDIYEDIILNTTVLKSILNDRNISFERSSTITKNIIIKSIILDDSFREYYNSGKFVYDGDRNDNDTTKSKGRKKREMLSNDDSYFIKKDLIQYFMNKDTHLINNNEDLTNIIYFCKLFKDYTMYYQQYQDAVTNHKLRLTKQLNKIEDDIDDDEDDSINNKEDDSSLIIKQKNNPLYTGFLQIKPSISSKIEEAYLLINRYCKGLEDIPREALYSESSEKEGLMQDYAKLIAYLFADTELTYQKNYKSTNNFRKVIITKNDIMNRLKHYTYTVLRNNTYKIFYHHNKQGDNGFLF